MNAFYLNEIYIVVNEMDHILRWFS